MTSPIHPPSTTTKDTLATTPELYANDIARVLLENEAIQERIFEMGAAISADYAGKRPLFVGVLKGVLFFMADLLRAVHIPLEVDFMAISSYSPETREHGVVRITKDLETSLEGRHVIFVEDMIDTGLTLSYLLRLLQARNPASLHVSVLFDKPSRRLVDIKPRYLGFRLPDLFVVGYGLDYREQYRNLPFVGVLKPETIRTDALRQDAPNETPLRS